MDELINESLVTDRFGLSNYTIASVVTNLQLYS